MCLGCAAARGGHGIQNQPQNWSERPALGRLNGSGFGLCTAEKGLVEEIPVVVGGLAALMTQPLRDLVGGGMKQPGKGLGRRRRLSGLLENGTACQDPGLKVSRCLSGKKAYNWRCPSRLCTTRALQAMRDTRPRWGGSAAFIVPALKRSALCDALCPIAMQEAGGGRWQGCCLNSPAIGWGRFCSRWCGQVSAPHLDQPRFTISKPRSCCCVSNETQ